MLDIQARRRLATVYSCPGCGSTHGYTASTPTKRNREYTGGHCHRCDRAFEIVAQRQYTVFASDFSCVAGTLDKLGPFKICDIVFPTICAFRTWYQERTAQLAEQARLYYERERVLQAEYQTRLKRQQEEATLLKEVEQMVVLQK